MKRLFSVILAVVVVALTIIACKDDFNEQDFLQMQSDLKIKQDSINRSRNKATADSSSQEVVQSFIDARNASGDLMAVTIVVREDNTPVQGVTVSISSGVGQTTSGKTQAILTGVTDALGVVVFNAVTIANSTVTISAPGYVSASALVDFGSPSPPIAVNVPDAENGGTKTIYIAPPKEFHNLSLPIYSESATAGSTAVLNGVFNWQQDLTNDPNVRDPLPAGLVIAADIGTALLANGTITGTAPIGDYRFTGAAGSLGVGAIDPATGAFSMRLPATAAGMTINLIYPRITANQRIAVRRLNGIDIAPEFRLVPTLWEPGNAANAIPVIPGAKAVFNGGTPPPPPGRGFDVTFATIARGLETGLFAPHTITATTTQQTLTNTTYNLNLRGRGFSSSPAVTITGGGGTGATATSSLRGFITSAAVTTLGTGFTASTPFDVQFTYTDATATVVAINKIDVTSTAAGEIALATLTLPNAIGFAGNGTAFTTSQGMQGFGVRIVNDGTNTPATATVQPVVTFGTDTEVLDVNIVNGGSGFTTAPTFTFSGGGSPSTQASMSVVVFRSRYTVTLSTTPATTPFKVKPNGMIFTFPTNAVDAQLVQSPAQVDRLSTNLSAVVSGASLLDQLMTDGTNLSAVNPQFTFRTSNFGSAPPTLTVVDQATQPAAANLTISTAGEVTAIVDPDLDAPAPTTSDLIPTAAATTKGDGYDAISVAVVPTITGAPGAGAAFILTTIVDVNTKEVQWDSPSTVVSRGSGYLPNLNRTSSQVNYTSQTNITVQTGQTYFRTIEGGTGVKQENVQN